MTDDQLLAAPIIVLGSPRSGTTALGEMLEVHSTLHGLVEPRLTWRYGNDSKSDRLQADDARPPVIAHIRKAFASQVRESGRPRLLEKTPSNALRLEFVLRIFPDARVIHIIRNGIDATLSIRSFWTKTAHGMSAARQGLLRQRLKEVQLSQLPYYGMEVIRRFAPKSLAKTVGQNLWGPRLPGMRAMLRDLELLEVCALQWRTCVELAAHAGATLPAQQYREIKLEDLNRETFLELLDFAGLEREPAVLDHFAKTLRPELSRGRRGEATDADLATIGRWITPTMQWLGYDM